MTTCHELEALVTDNVKLTKCFLSDYILNNQKTRVRSVEGSLSKDMTAPFL